MQKYGKIVETRFHEQEHESKTGLLKIHSRISERRGYESDKKLNKKWKERRPIRQGQEKRQGKPPPYHLKGGGRGENVSMEKRKTEVAPQPQRGRARQTTEKEKIRSHTALCHSRSSQIPSSPPAPSGWGIGGTKNGENTKNPPGRGRYHHLPRG